MKQNPDPSRVIKVSASRLNDFANCRELCRLRMERWRSRAPSLSLDFGLFFAFMLDTLYKKGLYSNPDPLSKTFLRAVEVNRQRWLRFRLAETDFPPDLDAQLEAISKEGAILLPLYLRHYQKPPWQAWRLRETEWNAEIEIPDFQVAGLGAFHVISRSRLDGLLEFNRRIYCKETKTTQRFGDTDKNLFGMISFQNRLYNFAGNQVFGKRWGGVIHDVIRRPSISPRKGETYKDFLMRLHSDVADDPSRYFYRFKVDYSQKDDEAFSAEFASRISEFIRWKEGILPHYRNDSGAVCLGRYRCEMFEACLAQGTHISRLGLYEQRPEGESK